MIVITTGKTNCIFICPIFIFSGVYADGPGAYLFHGVFEQQYVFHVMDHALCLSDSKQKSCDKHVKRGRQLKNNANFSSASSMYLLLMSAYLIAAKVQI